MAIEELVEPLGVADADPVAPRRQQVSEFGCQVFERVLPLRPGQAIPPALREVREVLSMRPSCCDAEPRLLLESLRSVFPDGFEHREPPRTTALQAADEALVHQGCEPIDNVHLFERFEAGDNVLHSFHPSGREDREQLKDRLLVAVEQLIAPLDSAAERLLPGWKVPWPAAEQLEAASQPISQIMC